jgi:hypothetical protein
MKLMLIHKIISKNNGNATRELHDENVPCGGTMGKMCQWNKAITLNDFWKRKQWDTNRVCIRILDYILKHNA